MTGFARQRRLRRPAQFRFVFAHATRAGDHRLTVLARGNGLPYARLGLAVGRRRIARSTRRNTFKRIVRESFRLQGRRLAGLDVVVLAKPAAAGAARGELWTSIERQWPILRRRSGVR